MQYIIQSKESQYSVSNGPYIFRNLNTRLKELTMKGISEVCAKKLSKALHTLQDKRVRVYIKPKCPFTMYSDFLPKS